jgi:glycosyltransferase involved in cell wall biosynthesis
MKVQTKTRHTQVKNTTKQALSPSVSIIIPAYNAQDTIKECIMSVLNSNYPRFEVIVIDDASTDRTAEVVRSFENVVLVEKEKNRGCAATKNLGAKKAKGEYFYFLDSDVVIYEDTVEKLVETALEYSVDMVCARYSRSPMNRGLVHHYKAMADYVFYIPKEYRAKVNLNGQLGGGGELFSRKSFEAVKGFDEKFYGASVEREDIWIKFYKAGFHSAANAQIKTRHFFPSFKGLIKAYSFRIYEAVKLLDGKNTHISYVSFSFESGKLGPTAAFLLLITSFACAFGFVHGSVPVIFGLFFLLFSREIVIETLKIKGKVMSVKILFLHLFFANLIFTAGASSLVFIKLCNLIKRAFHARR